MRQVVAVAATRDDPNPGAAGAAGAMASSTTDLAVFQALLAGELLQPNLLRAMKQTVAVPPDAGVLFPHAGLGIFRADGDCGPLWGNSGNDDAHVAHVRATETGSRVFVLAANGGTPALLRDVGPAAVSAACS